MIKRKLELAILAACVALGAFWALTTDYFSHHAFDLNWLINVSSLLTVGSFSVRGILPLRMLAVASQAFAIPYFMLQATPLWTPVGWTALFMAINLYHITRILLERRPVTLSADQQQLYDLAFHNFEPREFLKLLAIGKWETARQGDRVFSEGEVITRISIPISGSVDAIQRGRKVTTLGPGELIGAGIALTSQASQFGAQFTEDSRYMCWQKSDIDRFIDRHPETARKFNDVVNRHLVSQINKLSAASPAVSV